MGKLDQIQQASTFHSAISSSRWLLSNLLSLYGVRLDFGLCAFHHAKLFQGFAKDGAIVPKARIEPVSLQISATFSEE